MTKVDTELKSGYLKVKLDYAPTENGKEFDKWCKKYDFDTLGSDRRAWCSSLNTYFRDALGVAFNSGEMFLFYEGDVADLSDKIVNRETHYKERAFVDATPDEQYPLRILQHYRDECDLKWSDTSVGDAEGAFANMMNDNQDKRAVILDKAIAKLKE